MDKFDRKLGMHKEISRRDFINGMGVAVGSSAFSGSMLAKDLSAQDSLDYYPLN